MGWRIFRVTFGTVVGCLLLGSLAGILLTGPVVVRVPPADLEVSVSSDRLRETVTRLCGEFAPRRAERPENLAAVSGWIGSQLAEAGLAVEFQDYRAAGRLFRNVVGRRPGGADPAAGTYVIGAHYDAYGDSPGADDNASGVAVLLELARTLPRVRPKRTQLFVAFGPAEPPLAGSDQTGSHVFARKLVADGVAVQLMISLDSVGYYSDRPRSQGFPYLALRLLYPDRGNFLAIVGDLHAGAAIERVKRGMLAMRSIPVHSLRASPGWVGHDLLDHGAFLGLGLPAVQVTDTAFMRFPYYHLAEDTPEKLDYERMAAVVQALHGVLWEGRAAPE